MPESGELGGPSGLERQVRLLLLLAALEFEEVGIDLVRRRRVRNARGLACPATRLGRAGPLGPASRMEEVLL